MPIRRTDETTAFIFPSLKRKVDLRNNSLYRQNDVSVAIPCWIQQVFTYLAALPFYPRSGPLN